MFEKAKNKLSEKWWGIFVSYLLLFWSCFIILWPIFASSGVPVKLTDQELILTNRFFVLSLISFIFASITIVILEAFRRRKEWQQTEKIASLSVMKILRYGDKIRLIHKLTDKALHSHNQCYSHPNSSCQQQVTAYDGNDSNDHWIIKAKHGDESKNEYGKIVNNKDIIRLEHVNTFRNLHSHAGRPSPVTNQQEVTAYGKDGIGDTNDNWRLMSNESSFYEGSQIRLIHVLTDVTLHSHEGNSHPIFTSGQQEVTGYANHDENDFWAAKLI